MECASALNRLLRDGALEAGAFDRVSDRLETLSGSWVEVRGTEKLRQRALRLLRVHALRAADALQLGAALVASDENPPSLPFLSSDVRLNKAARKEGFSIS